VTRQNKSQIISKAVLLLLFRIFTQPTHSFLFGFPFLMLIGAVVAKRENQRAHTRFGGWCVAPLARKQPMLTHIFIRQQLSWLVDGRKKAHTC
jgi:hypothetical protein